LAYKYLAWITTVYNVVFHVKIGGKDSYNNFAAAPEVFLAANAILIVSPSSFIQQHITIMAIIILAEGMTTPRLIVTKFSGSGELHGGNLKSTPIL